MSELYESNALYNDNLVHNPEILVTKAITVLSGQNVVRGEVLGKVTLVVPTTGTAGAGNVGAETCTSVTGGPKTKLGRYVLTCTATGTNSGTFAVVDPDGLALPDAQLPASYTNANINFTLNDVGTDPSLGDTITITVTAGSGKYVKAVASNVNGSNQVQNMAIAAEDMDASTGDKVGIAYMQGEFNEGEITIDNSYTLANIKDELGRMGIFFKTAITN